MRTTKQLAQMTHSWPLQESARPIDKVISLMATSAVIYTFYFFLLFDITKKELCLLFLLNSKERRAY